MDVLVIGSGIVGAACAFELSRRGARVTVLERAGAPATGSTARSAAGLRHQFSLPVNVRMSLYSSSVFARFPELVGADAGFRRQGYLFLVPPGQEGAWREQNRMQREEGARAELLGPDALARRFPFVAPEGVALASWGPDDGVLDPHGATMGWLAAARRHGARFVMDAEVREVSRRGGRWRALSAAGPFEADAVVNAAGPQAARVAERAGMRLPVTPLRRCIWSTGPMAAAPDLPHPLPLTVDLASGVYLRSEGERVLFGLSNPDEPAGESLAVDWDWMETALERALPRFPFLERAGLDRAACWAGLYAVTPDHLPILGRAPGVEGWLDAVGFSGHGVQHAPATARIIADELLEGGSGLFDLAPFRHARFDLEAGAAGRGAEANIV